MIVLGSSILIWFSNDSLSVINDSNTFDYLRQLLKHIEMSGMIVGVYAKFVTIFIVVFEIYEW